MFATTTVGISYNSPDLNKAIGKATRVNRSKPLGRQRHPTFGRKQATIRLLSALIGLAIGLICPTFAQQNDPTPSNDTTARLVARAYVVSLFLRDNELIPLLAENRTYFREGGEAIRCMAHHGLRLTQGAPIDKEMGEHFLWLSRVLPPATAGDWEPYTTTTTVMRGKIHQWLRQSPVLRSRQSVMESAMESNIYSMILETGYAPPDQTPPPTSERVTCYNCSGMGKVTCPGCGGRGSKWSPVGGQMSWSPCAVCGGRRQINCPVWGGTGQLQR